MKNPKPLPSTTAVRYATLALLVASGLLLQLTLLPAYLADPFQPNFIIVAVVFLGLKRPRRFSPFAALVLGFVQDGISGIYLGLHAFCYLTIYFLLARVSDRLYTNNRFLLVLTVFLATVFSALFTLLMLAIFSVSQGMYAAVLQAVLPQALVNALAASVIFNLPLFAAQEETR